MCVLPHQARPPSLTGIVGENQPGVASLFCGHAIFRANYRRGRRSRLLQIPAATPTRVQPCSGALVERPKLRRTTGRPHW